MILTATLLATTTGYGDHLFALNRYRCTEAMPFINILELHFAVVVRLSVVVAFGDGEDLYNI